DYYCCSYTATDTVLF
nr:immunoglobulin light chain junction region [Macaca mulatta]